MQEARGSALHHRLFWVLLSFKVVNIGFLERVSGDFSHADAVIDHQRW